MKIRVMSDLHLEFGPMDLGPIGEDVLLLAGDVGLDDTGALWAAKYGVRHGVRVVMIAGNHEFYNARGENRRTLDETYEHLRVVERGYARSGFVFLEGGLAAQLGDVVFVGATLWTDYALRGSPDLAMSIAAGAMNDHHLIWWTAEETFRPATARAIHVRERGALADSIRAHRGMKVVVATHHLPSRRSIAGRYADDALGASYASNLDDLVAESGAALWVHGHTHVSQDYLLGATRVICNPRGYDGHELNPDFDPDLIVEV